MVVVARTLGHCICVGVWASFKLDLFERIAETWATTKRQEKRIEMNEMRMPRWMCGVTRKDRNVFLRTVNIPGKRKI